LELSSVPNTGWAMGLLLDAFRNRRRRRRPVLYRLPVTSRGYAHSEPGGDLHRVAPTLSMRAMLRFRARAQSSLEIHLRASPKRALENALGLKTPRGLGWMNHPRRAAYNRPTTADRSASGRSSRACSNEPQ